MAYFLLIATIVLVVGVNADSNNDNQNPFSGFPFDQINLSRDVTKRHALFVYNVKLVESNVDKRESKFQKPFHNIHMNTFQPFFPFPLHPIIPTFPTIKIPNPDDIINKNPNPGESYSGVVVQSSSGYTTDENGNVVKTGGTTVVTNDNGDVKEYKVGKNPPVIKNNIVPPFKNSKITITKGKTPPINLSELPRIDLPKLPDINIPGIINIKGVQLPSIDLSQLPDIPEGEYTKITITEVPVVPPMPLFFPQIHISSFSNDDLKSIKPGPNQHFFGSSTGSFTISSNVNGKKNYAGASKIIVNNNGQVDEQALVIENSV